MGTKALWELSLEELDKEIATTKTILETGGYFKVIADRLNLLQEQRDERLIEEGIVAGSKLGKSWRGGHDDSVA